MKNFQNKVIRKLLSTNNMLEDEDGLYQDRNCEMLFGGNQDNEIITFFFLKLKMRNTIFYLMYIIKLKLYTSCCQSISY